MFTSGKSLAGYRQMLKGRRCPQCGKLFNPEKLHHETEVGAHKVKEFFLRQHLSIPCLRCHVVFSLSELGVSREGTWVRPLDDSPAERCDLCDGELTMRIQWVQWNFSSVLQCDYELLADWLVCKGCKRIACEECLLECGQCDGQTCTDCAATCKQCTKVLCRPCLNPATGYCETCRLIALYDLPGNLQRKLLQAKQKTPE